MADPAWFVDDDCSALAVSGEDQTGFLPNEQERIEIAAEEVGTAETGFKPSLVPLMLDGVVTAYKPSTPEQEPDEYAGLYYPYKEWQDDPCMIYLGSETNPRTKFKYDYWLYKPVHNHPNGTSITSFEDISFLARHGVVDCDYGSSPICVAHYDTTAHSDAGDYSFGMARVQQLGLYYLATGRKPLLENQSDLDW